MTVTGATDRNCEASAAQRLTPVVTPLCKVTAPSLAPSRRLRLWPEEGSGVLGAKLGDAELRKKVGIIPPDCP